MCELIDGARVGGFEFGVQSTRGDGRHWQLRVRHTELGEPRIVASVEFARRPLALPSELLAFIQLPIHKAYGFGLPTLPVVAEAEACAEETRAVPPRCAGTGPVRPEPLRLAND